MKAPLEFRIHGMDCADEVAILRREIAPLVGSPDRLGFDILRGKMLIAPGTPVITPDQIVRVVGRTGMRAEPWQDVRPGAAEAGFWQRRGRTVMTALSATFLLSGFLAHVADAGLRAALGSEGVGLAAQVPTLAPDPLRGWHRSGRVVHRPAGLDVREAVTSRHEPPHDYCGVRSSRDRGVVRSSRGDLSVCAVARAGVMEHRPRASSS